MNRRRKKANFEDSFIQSDIPLAEHIEEVTEIKFDASHIPEGGLSNNPVSKPVVNLQECTMLYGAAVETAHAMIATRKPGVTHRELPDERRAAQGKLLFNICKKYNIQIPTEFEVLILGGALIADWQYMTVKESDIKKPKELKKDETN